MKFKLPTLAPVLAFLIIFYGVGAINVYLSTIEWYRR